MSQPALNPRKGRWGQLFSHTAKGTKEIQQKTVVKSSKAPSQSLAAVQMTAESPELRVTMSLPKFALPARQESRTAT